MIVRTLWLGLVLDPPMVYGLSWVVPCSKEGEGPGSGWLVGNMALILQGLLRSLFAIAEEMRTLQS